MSPAYLAITGYSRDEVLAADRGLGIACHVMSGSGEQGSWIELSVADSGTGIAPEVLDRIFEAFVWTKAVGLGSDMGLAMVHAIVHDHGGRVLVETAPRTGAVIRVVLPPADASDVADAPTTEPAFVAAPPKLRGRVMVVEDEAMVGDFMAELLRNWGLEGILHRDPLEARAWLEGSPPIHWMF